MWKNGSGKMVKFRDSAILTTMVSASMCLICAKKIQLVSNARTGAKTKITVAYLVGEGCELTGIPL